MILLDRVTKTYNRELGPSLDRITLHVEPKEFVIVVGQSGAGKTTLLRLLTREERPTSGKIIVGGIDYDKLADAIARKMPHAPNVSLNADEHGFMIFVEQQNSRRIIRNQRYSTR